MLRINGETKATDANNTSHQAHVDRGLSSLFLLTLG